MIPIPQSTAYTVVFKAFLSSDHVSEATGKTIAITISKAGGAFANPAAGATNATEIASGWYKVALGTGDVDTLGVLAVRGAVATIDDVGLWFGVVSATTGGLTNLDATISSVTAILGALNTAASSGDPGAATTLTAYLKQLVNTLEGTAGIPTWASGVAPANAVSIAEAIRHIYNQIGTAGVSLTNLGDTRIANLDNTVSSRMATYTQPTGFLAATFPATLASTTNITAGTIATVTTLTNLPAITANWLTATGIAADAITAAKIADGAIDAATFASGALDAVWSTATRTITGGTITTYTGNTVQTGDSFARIGATGSGLTTITALLPTALVGGRMDSSVGAMASGLLTATAIAADAITDAKVASDVTIASVAGSVGSIASGGITSGSFGAGAIDAAAIATDAFGSLELAASAASEIATAVATQITSDHGSGSYLTATSVTVSDKTGFSLASTGLDSIAVTAPSGVANTFPGMVVQLWRRFFKRAVKDASTIKTYGDNGTTVVTTQSYTSTSTTDDVGAAS